MFNINKLMSILSSHLKLLKVIFKQITIVIVVLIGLQACSSGGGDAPSSTPMTDGDGGTNTGDTPMPPPPQTTTAGGNPDTPVQPAAFSDEFDTDSLADWQRRHQVEGTAAQYTRLDIGQSQVGALTIVPTLTPGWFRDGDAPLLFKTVTGDFSVEVQVHAESTQGNGLAPRNDFNSAGVMARDPRGATGSENHIMLNIGRQNGTIDNRVGSETKTTVNSNSQLFLQSGTNRGRLTLCRVGNLFTSFRWLDNETGWTETNAFERADLPDTLQVGMVVNGYSGPDLVATFDYIRLRVPSSLDDCVN